MKSTPFIASHLQSDIEFMRDDSYHLRSHLNYDFEKTFSAEVDSVSLTVPDMTLSIQEIVSKFTRGLAVPVSSSILNSEEDLSFIDNLNEFERIDLHRQLVNRSKVLRDTFYKSQQDASLASEAVKRQQSIDKAVADKLNSLTPPSV